jgi:UDP-glucuronate decarboxylase
MHPDDGRVVSNFIVQALRGDPITLYGEGNQTRSFCYVDDLIDGLLAMMDQNAEIGPLNLGNPTEFTIRQLAEMVLKLTGSKSEIVFRPLPTDDPAQRQPDITRAKKTLAWQPKVALEDGLKETIRYFKKILKDSP